VPTALVALPGTLSGLIDMTFSRKGMLSIPQQDRQDTTIAAQPRNGSNPELIAIGRGYGVIKLPSDPPHWSDDGR